MQNCRNCGSTEIQELGFVGEVAPFFMKRVLDLEQRFAPNPNQDPLKRLIRSCAAPFRGLFEKIFRPTVMTELSICNSCNFLSTKYPFSDVAIMNLYSDYRSDSYNKERIHYEPSYAKLAGKVGFSEIEIAARTNGLNRWLLNKIEHDGGFSMLDFGGADGRFLPNLPGGRFVYEISDITPVPGVVRIGSEDSLENYSYIQIAHVLEHVPEPLKLTKHVSSFLKPGGYLYIELPQELDDAKLASFRQGNQQITHGVHEHINQYTPRAVTSLLKSAGLEIVSVETQTLDIGWCNANLIRALARRASI